MAAQCKLVTIPAANAAGTLLTAARFMILGRERNFANLLMSRFDKQYSPSAEKRGKSKSRVYQQQVSLFHRELGTPFASGPSNWASTVDSSPN